MAITNFDTNCNDVQVHKEQKKSNSLEDIELVPKVTGEVEILVNGWPYKN